MEEKKTNELTNELTDEALDNAAGGLGPVVVNLKAWCSNCNTYVHFRLERDGKKCLTCGNLVEPQYE